MKNDLLTILIQNLSKIVISEKEGVDNNGNLTGEIYNSYNGFLFANEFAMYISPMSNEFIIHLENHLYSFPKKLTAVRFLRKHIDEFNKLKADFDEIERPSLEGTYIYKVNRNVEDQRKRETDDSYSVYYYDVVMDMSIIQLNTIHKILDWLNSNFDEHMKTSEQDWGEIRKFQNSIPILVIDEKFNLNEATKTFELRMDKFQATLLYKHLERMKCILPYDNNRSKGRILHLLTGHSLNKLSELVSPVSNILNRDFPSTKKVDEEVKHHENLISLLEELIQQIERDKKKIEELKY